MPSKWSFIAVLVLALGCSTPTLATSPGYHPCKPVDKQASCYPGPHACDSRNGMGACMK